MNDGGGADSSLLPVIESPHTVQLALTLNCAELAAFVSPWLTEYRRFIVRFVWLSLRCLSLLVAVALSDSVHNV